MTKLYIPLLAIAMAGGTASAQQSLEKRMTNPNLPRLGQVSAARATNGSTNRELIWSDDFSNAANWEAGSIEGYDADTWVIGTPATLDGFLGDITSTTAANGFALFDSYEYCGGNQNATLTYVNGVDVSLYAGVVLRFQQYTRAWRGGYFVDLSVDGGNTWTEVEVNGRLGTNDDTPDPDVVELDVDQIVAGAEDVRLRFRYFSTVADHGAGAGCDYGWMVDDVSFISRPDSEIKLEYIVLSTASDPEDEGEIEYGRIPVDQMPASVGIGGGAVNFGMNPQTNAELIVTFEDAGGATIPALTTSLALGDNGAFDAIDTSDVYTSVNIDEPLAIGTYTARYTLNSDEIGFDDDLSNNELARKFLVTANEYSLDGIDVYPNDELALDYTGTFSWTGDPEFYCMNMYRIISPTTVTGLSMRLVRNQNIFTVGGTAAQVEGFIFEDVDGVRNQSLGFMRMEDNAMNGITSGAVTVTTQIANSGTVSMNFSQPLALQPGTYYAVVRLTGSGTSNVNNDPEVVVFDDKTVPQPGWASAIYLPNDEEGRHSYTNGNAYAIRLFGSPTAGIDEAATLSDISIYPNPTDGQFRISSDRTELLFVEVSDMLGQVVHTASFMGSTTIDLGHVAAGVYNVSVNNKTGRSVHRVSVK